MNIRICDKCGKLMDRYVGKSKKYEIHRAGKDYGYGEDREERKTKDYPISCYMRHLDLCDKCYSEIEKSLDIVFSTFPKNVSLELESDEDNDIDDFRPRGYRSSTNYATYSKRFNNLDE